MTVPANTAVWPEDWLRLNAICPYYTMFPLEFPLEQLRLYPDAARVLDPFCGRGTTLYAARLTGRSAVGIDVNPVAVSIAQSKLVRATVRGVVGLAGKILERVDKCEPPRGEFWEWCFDPNTLREVSALRDGLLGCRASSAAVLLRALMLGILHGPRNKRLPSYLSNQMPRSYASKPAYAVRYWQQRGLKPVRIDTLNVIRRRAARMLSGVPPCADGRVVLGDAASTLLSLRQRFDLIVTSPPYYSMRTYVSDQWLRNWFVGGPPDVSYETSGQLARQPNRLGFISALADVWRASAKRCNPGARLVIRFGALPSSKLDPEKILLASLRESAAGWLVRDVRPAGIASGNRRQADQFGGVGGAVAEVDVTAELLLTRRSRTHF